MQQQQVQLRYFTVTAPTAGIVGDVPVRVGNQVTPQTVLTTIDQNETLEVYVSVPIERARGAEERAADSGARAATARETLATTTVNFISPRVDDQTQSVLVKGAGAESGRRRCARRSSCARASSGRPPKGWSCR